MLEIYYSDFEIIVISYFDIIIFRWLQSYAYPKFKLYKRRVHLNRELQCFSYIYIYIYIYDFMAHSGCNEATKPGNIKN